MVKTSFRKAAAVFPRFVDHEQRQKAELPFLAEQLKEFTDPYGRIFNASLGSGSTTIGLVFGDVLHPDQIVSNEIEPEFIKVATEEARAYDVPLVLSTYNW